MIDEIFSLIAQEERRQSETLMLIPSENFTSSAVREAVGSVLCNKYSEGYPNARYYEGNEQIDQIELLAISRAKKLFDAAYVNVQPYSGSPANSEILFALCEPGDTVMGLSLSSGGHLTHGHPNITFSGKFYKSVQFGLGSDARIDYESMRTLALEHKPKVIILGTTAYPFIIDWEKARQIADEVGAFLVADISHIVGLVIAGVHPSPMPFAHVVMTTTHKSLRGPRGAMIMVTHEGVKKDSFLPKMIDMAVFPGMQGGPHNHTTAGIAVALAEASTDLYLSYGKQIIINAKALADALKNHGIKLVGGGTENHLMIMDFSDYGAGHGSLVATALNCAGIVTNKNTVPGDKSPFYPSGVRIGTPAVTTKGMNQEDMVRIALLISKVVEHIKSKVLPEDKQERLKFLQDFKLRMSSDAYLKDIAEDVKQLCQK
jgi:glycine hydroxymethyltransferase